MTAGIVIPTLTPGDAVSRDALGMASVLRSEGVDVEFFVLRNATEEATRPMHELPSRLLGSNDAMIYHHQIGFEAGVRAVETHPVPRKIVKYHNITPPEFFQGVSEEMVAGCRQGLQQVDRLAHGTAEIWADSEFNASEVRERVPGRRVEVLPPFHQVDDFLAVEPDYRSALGFDDWATNLLVVGRVAPNKNLGLALKAFAEYRARFDPAARLILAGDTPLSSYCNELKSQVEKLNQGGHVYLTGKIELAELKSLYLLADVLLTTSFHEGFCVPLVEAMALRLPVVAVPAAAVPLTAGPAASYATDPIELAYFVQRLLVNPKIQEEQLHLGIERYRNHFSTAAITRRFRELFARETGSQRNRDELICSGKMVRRFANAARRDSVDDTATA